MKNCLKRLLILILIVLLTVSSCALAQEETLDSLHKTGSLPLLYATQFSIDYYEGGCKLITIADGSRYLVVPENAALPEGISSDIWVIRQPLHNIYLAATASMCLFDALDEISAIRLSGTREDGWYIDNARDAMARGDILFAGKYSEPDYELFLAENCPLAIESLMIGHASDVRGKLEELGIPVLVDHASLESHPLGRTEWIKLYAALFDDEDKAEELFSRQTDYLNSIAAEEAAGKTAAFFYVSSSGRIVARKSGDYVSRMIELAGGDYVFSDLGDPETATSTVTLEMETFFASAKDADYIIYNSTIGGEIRTIDDLIQKNELFAEFRAVQNGNVWCTNQNMYQQTTELGLMIQSFHKIFSGEADELNELPYLYRLK